MWVFTNPVTLVWPSQTGAPTHQFDCVFAQESVSQR
jgi:hypothetical protein